MSKSVLPIFSSRSFRVSSLKCRSLIHFEFVLVYGVRECSNYVILPVSVQFSQNHYWKTVFSPIIYSCLLCLRLNDHMNVGLFLGSLICLIYPDVYFYSSCILFCLLYFCRIVWNQRDDTSSSDLPSQDYFVYLESLIVPYKY